MTLKAKVIGSGVAGLCVAAELEARGVRVEAFDSNGGPGPHSCSWWAGGMLAPFCEGETAEEPVSRLGVSAADWWESNGAQVKRNGSLVVALSRDRRELDRFARRTREHQWVEGDELAELEPLLAERFERALFFPREAHLDPREALVGLRDRLAKRGVRFSEAQENGEANGLAFDCRGIRAQESLTDLRGVKGEIISLRAPEISLSRPVRLLHPRHPLYVVPRADGVFALGATQIEGGESDSPTARSVLELLSAAYALHPAFGEAGIDEIGADARPAFRDNLPRIRRRGDRIFVNGLFRHGFLLAPSVAKMAIQLALDGVETEFCDENSS